MSYIDFLSSLHRSSRRDYLARVCEFPKDQAAVVAKQFGPEYWDGDRRYGYGGYHYDGRWRSVAEALANQYRLQPKHRVLDVGCGKGFLLYELSQVVPGLLICGIDISRYAILNAKEEVRSQLVNASAPTLPFPDHTFDLVLSLNTLHNLRCFDLEQALLEIGRVGRSHKYICVESYRNEVEKTNLLYWQLTCESFYSPEEWSWWFQRCQYTGDHSFIFFE